MLQGDLLIFPPFSVHNATACDFQFEKRNRNNPEAPGSSGLPFGRQDLLSRTELNMSEA
jgi:hypothetical protein